MELPDYLRKPQRLACEAALRALAAGQRRGLWLLPTGTGKTTAALTLARVLDLPTGFLVHRDFLVQQTLDECAFAWPGVTTGVIQAERDEWRADLYGRAPQLVVASVPSLGAERLATIPRDRFGLLIVDECHRSPSPSWARVIRHFETGFTLGMTATPTRLDRQGLAPFYGPRELYAYSIKQAMDDGVLVPVRQWAIRTATVLGEQALAGNKEALSADVNSATRNGQIVKAYLERAADRRAVVFCVDVPHVLAVTEAFRAAGVAAVAVTGKDGAARPQKLRDFAAGVYRVMVNCNVAIEGFNDRGVSCIIMARPTESRLLYLQAVGRGLRTADGKSDCIVLDVVDLSRKHNLSTILDLLGVRKTKDADGANVLDLARAEETEEAEAKVRAREQLTLFPLAWVSEEVSPWPELPSLAGYEPRKPWQVEPASDKQLQALHKLGLAVGRDVTKGEASWLFDRAKEYDFVFPTPATPAQERWLRRAGAWEEGLTKREAGRRIGEIKQGAEVAR